MALSTTFSQSDPSFYRWSQSQESTSTVAGPHMVRELEEAPPYRSALETCYFFELIPSL